ncbi:MAG: hypothetical protein HC779_05550 [Phyllobacteriaceae bacterium]|nr:hypothetical protein [Phyllobacteriaceae bacterium]
MRCGSGLRPAGKPVETAATGTLLPVSAATIRNVMSDLEERGYLHSPHTSAGRLPTDVGMRMFVSGLLQVGGLDSDERQAIEAHCQAAGRSVEEVLNQATSTLSGLSKCASLVLAPKLESPLKHIEFVSLKPGRALVVMVSESGVVENRLVEVPADLPISALIEGLNGPLIFCMPRTRSQSSAAARPRSRR